MPFPEEEVRRTLDRLQNELLAQRGDHPHWTGQLSASALSTATAVSAIAIVLREKSATEKIANSGRSTPTEDASTSLRTLVQRGVDWCLSQQNDDGGFGDTDRSHSNIATSILVRSAFTLGKPHVASETRAAIKEADSKVREYIGRAGGIPALRRRYGTDKTFVIPILTNAALAGLVTWKEVQPLPFELAAVPQRMYRAVRMPVVSYAIPALVAIGQARFHHLPPRNPLVYAIRRSAIQRTLRVLEQMQPTSGGYLEATPLTSFVLMSLAAIGRANHPVATNAIRFLEDSILDDGSWPIDTNLATWITSLSIHALSEIPEGDVSWADAPLLQWLLKCQHLQRHPFTGADPGGWGWTDLSGAVPDGDDTPAAIIALGKIANAAPAAEHRIAEMQIAATRGVQWLLNLQNRDGGWPTFCRGWGKLPFDRSSSDLTAHSLRALDSAQRFLGLRPSDFPNWEKAVRKGWGFLIKSQRPDGSILPLWFGNQDQENDDNPFYGTARALMACETLREKTPIEPRFSDMLQKAAGYLTTTQNQDGGWGGGPSLTLWLQRERILQAAQATKTAETTSTSPAEAAAIEQAGSKPPEAGEKLSITSSVEETSIVLEALSKYVIWLEDNHGNGSLPPNGPGKRTSGRAEGCRQAIIRGVEFLCDAVKEEKHRVAWPIGFYFAKLWYHEKQYASTFACAALGSVLQAFRTEKVTNDNPA